MYKYFLEVLFSGWEKTALLVFLTLALCVGKKPNVLFVRLGKLAYNICINEHLCRLFFVCTGPIYFILSILSNFCIKKLNGLGVFSICMLLTCVYISVVLLLLCPNKTCMLRKLTPCSYKCVA